MYVASQWSIHICLDSYVWVLVKNGQSIMCYVKTTSRTYSNELLKNVLHEWIFCTLGEDWDWLPLMLFFATPCNGLNITEHKVEPLVLIDNLAVMLQQFFGKVKRFLKSFWVGECIYTHVLTVWTFFHLKTGLNLCINRTFIMYTMQLP